jgi:hypothetical protein
MVFSSQACITTFITFSAVLSALFTAKAYNVADVKVLSPNSRRLDLFLPTVNSTASQQKFIYHNSNDVTITGTNFNINGNSFRFSNGILGDGKNYSTVSTSTNRINLHLVSGSTWRKPDNLPGYLTILAVNASEGFVSVGPKNSGRGVDVATVFERPQVYFDTTKTLYRTHSHELRIKGTGFPLTESGYKPKLIFSSALLVDVDYSLTVISRTEILLTLLDSRAWHTSSGPLYIRGINTRGDVDGLITLSPSVQVARVVDDIGGSSTGVEIFPMGGKVYQSALSQQIQIVGTGFKTGMTLAFEPSLIYRVDFNMVVMSKNQVSTICKLCCGADFD